MLAAMVVAYPLSMPVAKYVLLSMICSSSGTQMAIASRGSKVYRVIYAPAFLLSRNCPPFERLLSAEMMALNDLFGNPLLSAAPPQVGKSR
jgi:hypothetical protein